MRTLTNTQLPIFERTVCDCKQCRAACTAKPGGLIPSDLQTIHRQVAPEVPLLEWASQYLSASEGAKVARPTPTGLEVFHVPSLVPKQQADGSCIFRTEEGLCGIHKVSPFGCAYFDTHDQDDGEEASERAKYMVMQQMDDHVRHGVYSLLCEYLKDAGLTARPIEERNAAYVKAIQAAG